MSQPRPARKRVNPKRPFGDIVWKHRALRFAFALARGPGNPCDEGRTEMTEVSKSVCSNSAANLLPATRRSRAGLAALAGLAMLASSIQGANAVQPLPVREVDDPGRIPYESLQTI